MTVSFELSGFDQLGKFGKEFGDKVQKQVDLGSKAGINKAADLITYGRVSGISAGNVKSDSVVSRAANALRIPQEHVFYRTFVRGIKVSVGRGRGAKPYASVMMRGNGINVADLLASGNDAKAMYGFTSRKKGVGSKVRPNMRSKAANARVGGRRSGKVRVAGRVYNNSYIEDGSYRASSAKVNRHYMKNLGAKAMKLNGKRFLLLQKKHEGQTLPYPVKVVKINKIKVMRALNAAASYGARSKADKIVDLQTKEVHKRLKKFGFEIK